MKALIEGALWWVAGVILWMTTVSSITVAEAAVAVPTAAGCAALAVVARRTMSLRFTVTRQWLRLLVLVPAGAIADTGRLVAWLLRGARDRPEKDAILARPIEAGVAPRAIGLRAAATTAISATPGSVVVDSDGDAGRLVLHRVVGGWPDLDERVSA